LNEVAEEVDSLHSRLEDEMKKSKDWNMNQETLSNWKSE